MSNEAANLRSRSPLAAPAIYAYVAVIEISVPDTRVDMGDRTVEHSRCTRAASRARSDRIPGVVANGNRAKRGDKGATRRG